MPATLQIQQETSGFQPHLFQEQTQRFLSSCSRRGLSPGTNQYYSFHLLGLERFLAARKEPLHPSTFSELLQTLIHDMSTDGYALRTQLGRLHTCRQFYQYLFPDEEWSPLSVPLPDDENSFPEKSDCFTQEEVSRILEQPNRRRFTGYRDCTMLLILMDTGIRLNELCNLKLSDIDWQDQVIRITGGKVWITQDGPPFRRALILHMLIKHCRGGWGARLRPYVSPYDGKNFSHEWQYMKLAAPLSLLLFANNIRSIVRWNALRSRENKKKRRYPLLVSPLAFSFIIRRRVYLQSA